MEKYKFEESDCSIIKNQKTVEINIIMISINNYKITSFFFGNLEIKPIVLLLVQN